MFFDADDVKQAARGRWPEILARLGVDGSRLTGAHCACPGCGGKDRFRFDDLEGRGTWICGGGGNFQSGDGLGLVAHVTGLSWKESVARVGTLLDVSPRRSQKQPRPSQCPPPSPGRKAPPKRPAYDPTRLESFARRCPHSVDADWLSRRSPLPIEAEQGVQTAERFLSAVFEPGETALIFVSEYSQGDFGWRHEEGTFRLGRKPGTRSVPARLPEGGPLGVWFLAAPVTGRWEPNPNVRQEHGGQKLGRRHGGCLTAWRYLVLESDEAPLDLWLRALVQLPLPVVAVYSSGGRSIHVLARVAAGSKADWDSLRDDLRPILCPLGADPGAMTAVRLSRLPGTLRRGTRGKDGKVVRYDEPRLQRLLYLNPGAEPAPILDVTS